MNNNERVGLSIGATIQTDRNVCTNMVEKSAPFMAVR